VFYDDFGGEERETWELYLRKSGVPGYATVGTAHETNILKEKNNNIFRSGSETKCISLK